VKRERRRDNAEYAEDAESAEKKKQIPHPQKAPVRDDNLGDSWLRW
jgi:hypothetical protein